MARSTITGVVLVILLGNAIALAQEQTGLVKIIRSHEECHEFDNSSLLLQSIESSVKEEALSYEDAVKCLEILSQTLTKHDATPKAVGASPNVKLIKSYAECHGFHDLSEMSESIELSEKEGLLNNADAIKCRELLDESATKLVKNGMVGGLTGGIVAVYMTSLLLTPCGIPAAIVSTAFWISGILGVGIGIMNGAQADTQNDPFAAVKEGAAVGVIAGGAVPLVLACATRKDCIQGAKDALAIGAGHAGTVALAATCIYIGKEAAHSISENGVLRGISDHHEQFVHCLQQLAGPAAVLPRIAAPMANGTQQE